MITLDIPLGERSYRVLVGPGTVAELRGLMPETATRAAIVTQPGIGLEVATGLDQQVFAIGEGEEAKTLSTVEDLCRRWSLWGLNRADVVVAVGGGLVTDVAGLAAALYHRGVEVIHVPTTLLGQIDAAIGGKTGVNLPEGKNLVGAYWQPSAVICDTAVLDSLPEREMRSGLGELAKYHFLGGGDLDSLPIDERVSECVRIKADVVASDEREGNRRAILNYGHTLAHALETVGDYDLRHGEAVAIGLVYAARLAHALDRVPASAVEEHERVVSGYGLADRLPSGVDLDQLVVLMGRDKKALRGLTFVLDGPAGVEPVAGVSPVAARAVLDEIVASDESVTSGR